MCYSAIVEADTREVALRMRFKTELIPCERSRIRLPEGRPAWSAFFAIEDAGNASFREFSSLEAFE